MEVIVNKNWCLCISIFLRLLCFVYFVEKCLSFYEATIMKLVRDFTMAYPLRSATASQPSLLSFLLHCPGLVAALRGVNGNGY